MYISFGLFLLAFSITASLIPYIIKICTRFKIIDFQDFRKQKEKPKVRIGGIAIIFGTLGTLLLTKIFFRNFFAN